MNKREKAALHYILGLPTDQVLNYDFTSADISGAFLAGAQHGYAEGRRDMNEECAQLACAYSITGLDGLAEEIRALVADEEKE